MLYVSKNTEAQKYYIKSATAIKEVHFYFGQGSSASQTITKKIAVQMLGATRLI